MEKTIFEKICGEFERQGDYFIPCLALPPEKEQPIGLFGRQHLDYLKQYRKVTYKGVCEGDCKRGNHSYIIGWRLKCRLSKFPTDKFVLIY